MNCDTKELGSGNAAAALLDVYNSLKTSSTPATKAINSDNGNDLLEQNNAAQQEKAKKTAKAGDLSASEVQARTTALGVSSSSSSMKKIKSSDSNIACKNTKSNLPDSPKKKTSLLEIENDDLSKLNFSFPWTCATHVRFLFAIFDYAIKKASPKKLMKLMGYMPDSLTSEHVKSHLQKFRMHYHKTRSVEVGLLNDALKTEAKNEKKHLLTQEEQREVLTMYPLHKKVMHYHRANVSQSMLPRKRLKRKRNFSSMPDKNSHTFISAEKIDEKRKLQKTVTSNAAHAATLDAPGLRSSGSEVTNSKISKLKSEMDVLMKRHQKYLEQQNQQVLRYSYMSNVQSAIPAPLNTIDANDTTPGINREGFSTVQDALAALRNLGDKTAADEITTLDDKK